MGASFVPDNLGWDKILTFVNLFFKGFRIRGSDSRAISPWALGKPSPDCRSSDLNQVPRT